MKNLSKLGKALSKAEQKEINGGGLSPFIDLCSSGDGAGQSCNVDAHCCPGLSCAGGSGAIRWHGFGQGICY